MGGLDAEDFFAVVGHGNNEIVLAEISVKVGQLGLDPKVVRRDDFPVAGATGKGVEADVLFEKPPQPLKNAAFQVGVVFLAENLLQRGHPECEADRLVGITCKVIDQTEIFAEAGNQHSLTEGSQDVGAVEEVLRVELTGAHQVFHRDLGQSEDSARRLLFARGKVVISAAQHLVGDMRDGTKTAALDQHRTLVEFLGRLHDFAVRAEHGGPTQPLGDQLEAHQTVVDRGKIRAVEADHVHLDAFRREVVEQAADQLFRFPMEAEGPVDQIDPHNSDCFLLRGILRVEHADVDDDLVDPPAGDRLEADTHPAVRFVVPVEAARRHGVGKNEKCLFRAHLCLKALIQQGVFVPEHAAEALAADVALHGPVNGVAESHVVGRHRFGHRAGRRTNVKKPPRHLLSRPDLGQGAVDAAVEIEIQRFAVGRKIVIVGGHESREFCAP